MRVLPFFACCLPQKPADDCPKPAGLRLPLRGKRIRDAGPSTCTNHLLALLFIYLHGRRDHPAFPECASRASVNAGSSCRPLNQRFLPDQTLLIQTGGRLVGSSVSTAKHVLTAQSSCSRISSVVHGSCGVAHQTRSCAAHIKACRQNKITLRSAPAGKLFIGASQGLTDGASR